MIHVCIITSFTGYLYLIMDDEAVYWGWQR